MYERWLDKSVSPGFEDLLAYSGESHIFWRELDVYLKNTFSAQQQIRFPYGNKYGWSSKYSIKKKHLCDAFAEKGAFALHFRLNNRDIDLLYADLTDYAKEICDKKYPCSQGGWLTYRICSKAQLDDAIKLLSAKAKSL